MSEIIHYGSNGASECGADIDENRGQILVQTTLDPKSVTCRICRGWLPIVAPRGDGEASA